MSFRILYVSMFRLLRYFFWGGCLALALQLPAQTVLPVNQPALNCVDTSFNKLYYTPPREFSANCIGPIGGNQILVAGFASPGMTFANSSGYLARLDQQGNIISSVVIDSAQAVGNMHAVFLKQFAAPDGGVLILGVSPIVYPVQQYYQLLVRLNAAGAVMWTQRYYSPYWSNSGNPTIPTTMTWQHAAFDTESGDIFVSGTEFGMGIYVSRINGATGRVIWSKAIDGMSSKNSAGLDVKDSVVHLINLGPNNTYSNFLHYQLHKNTGTLLTTSAYGLGSPSYQPWMIRYAYACQKLSNGHYLIGGTPYGLLLPIFPTAYSLVELDEQFHFVQAFTIRSTNTSTAFLGSFHQLPNGYTVVAFGGSTNTLYLPWYFVFLKDGQITKQFKTYNQLHTYEKIDFVSFSDTAFYCMGRRKENILPTGQLDFSLELARMSAADTGIGCMGYPINLFHVLPFTLDEQAAQPDTFMVIRDSVYRELGLYPTAANNYALIRSDLCSSLAVCDSFDISVDAPVVCLNQSLTFRVHKNWRCGSPVTWQYNPALVGNFVRVDDTTYRIQYTAPFSGYVYATMDACETKRDSIFVQALPPMPAVNLGADAYICGNQSIVLHGQPGYATYQWQDGSTDSVFTVTQPGIYYLTVTDACGSGSSDTIRVSPYQPPGNISLGPDRDKCNQDTIQLSVAPGYAAYEWSPPYALTQQQPHAVLVNPLVDTFYAVQVEYVTGCYSSDTIRIRVHQSPSIHLGTDTSFCTGQSVVLNAGNGFTQYQWSNGLNSSQVTVTAAGIYSVVATTVHGCVSTDTFQVWNVYPLPVVRLDDRDWLCAGQPRNLQAGNFQSYVWQDLSTSSNFTVQQPGTYYVTVTDEHRCSGSDTVVIRRVEPQPQNFLPDRIEKCSFETIALQPTGSYNHYLWSNLSQQNSISISEAGTYWLQVTDNKDCIGSDTTTVLLKDCFRGVYLPSAFSPNGDGRNEQLRATIYGNCELFDLKIYDRLGRCVYGSVQPHASWDGTYRGKPVEQGTYVWLLRYRLSGQVEVSEKGTVTVIR